MVNEDHRGLEAGFSRGIEQEGSGCVLRGRYVSICGWLTRCRGQRCMFGSTNLSTSCCLLERQAGYKYYELWAERATVGGNHDDGTNGDWALCYRAVQIGVLVSLTRRVLCFFEAASTGRLWLGCGRKRDGVGRWSDDRPRMGTRETAESLSRVCGADLR
jgi:hypothetical protein